jgi:hypothetical protein
MEIIRSLLVLKSKDLSDMNILLILKRLHVLFFIHLFGFLSSYFRNLEIDKPTNSGHRYGFKLAGDVPNQSSGVKWYIGIVAYVV